MHNDDGKNLDRSSENIAKVTTQVPIKLLSATNVILADDNYARGCIVSVHSCVQPITTVQLKSVMGFLLYRVGVLMDKIVCCGKRG